MPANDPNRRDLSIPWLGALSVIFCSLLISTAQAQTKDTSKWPNKPIKVILPAAPGGAVDTIGRLLAEKLTQALGQAVIPENHTGAATMIASELTAKAAPDGYTVLFNTGSHAINAALRKNLRYDSVADFAPVSLIATLPDILVVNPALPIYSVKELIAYTQQHPGKISFGSSGSGSASHLDNELFRAMTGTDFLHVPYKTGMTAVADLVGGHVDALFFNSIGVLPHIKSGRLRALAITSQQRSELVPDLPTMEEAGVPGYVANAWYGAMVRAGTPAYIVDKLNTEIVKALKTKEVRDALTASGAEIIGSTPKEMGLYLQQDIERWKNLVQKTPSLREMQ